MGSFRAGLRYGSLHDSCLLIVDCAWVVRRNLVDVCSSIFCARGVGRVANPGVAVAWSGSTELDVEDEFPILIFDVVPVVVSVAFAVRVVVAAVYHVACGFYSFDLSFNYRDPCGIFDVRIFCCCVVSVDLSSVIGLVGSVSVVAVIGCFCFECVVVSVLVMPVGMSVMRSIA